MAKAYAKVKYKKENERHWPLNFVSILMITIDSRTKVESRNCAMKERNVKQWERVEPNNDKMEEYLNTAYP